MLRRCVLILITIFWGQIFTENSYSQTPENPEITTKNKNKAEDKNPFSIPVRILQTPLTELDDEKNWERQRHEDAYTEKNISIQENIAKSSENVAHFTYLQLWVSICSLIGLLTTAVFAGLAWRESKRATAEAVQTTKAAWRNLEIAEDTSRRQLRAYLSLEKVNVPEEVPKGNFMVRIAIKNSGQTPAIITKIGLNAFVVREPMIAKDISNITLTEVSQVIGAGGGASFYAATLKTIPGLEQEIFSNHMSAHVICRITYKDIYDDEHQYNFVRSIDGKQRNIYGSFGINEDFPDEFS